MTIYALSTGPGVSGVAIVRLSGKETSTVIKIVNKQKPSKTKSSNIKKNQ